MMIIYVFLMDYQRHWNNCDNSYFIFFDNQKYIIKYV